MIAKRGGIGIACDNNAAIEIVGEHYLYPHLCA